jgi:hypothetical protein
MKINTGEYEINGLKIDWGKSLSEVRSILEGFEKFQPYGGWPNIRCKCPEIFGLAATEVEVRAPYEDRPVLQVQYSIAPVNQGSFEMFHSPYLEQLENILGKAVKCESDYTHQGLSKEYLYSVVVFNAKWLFDDIRISLSVYGGTRNDGSGPCGAGIFIDWTNEIKAANPFREKREQLESALSDHIKDNIAFDKFKLSYKQMPFRITHYGLKVSYVAGKESILRAAQMALYTRDLLQTPKIIQGKLYEDEIGFYRVPELNKIFISNKWDTIYIDATEDKEKSLIFHEVLPARWPGGRELELKDLRIKDSKTSDALLHLIQKIETETGIEIQRKETYDD